MKYEKYISQTYKYYFITHKHRLPPNNFKRYVKYGELNKIKHYEII